MDFFYTTTHSALPVSPVNAPPRLSSSGINLQAWHILLLGMVFFVLGRIFS